MNIPVVPSRSKSELIVVVVLASANESAQECESDKRPRARDIPCREESAGKSGVQNRLFNIREFGLLTEIVDFKEKNYC